MHSRRLPHDVNWRLALLRRRAEQLPPPPDEVPTSPPVRWRRSWRFPTEAAAQRWNDEWDEILERKDAIHPAFLRIGGTLIQDPLVGVLARIAGCVLAEEARSGVPYPFMRARRTYRLQLRATPYQSRREGAQPSLIFSLHSEVIDSQGELIWATDATRQYPSDVIPAAIAELWRRRRPRPTDEEYERIA